MTLQCYMVWNSTMTSSSKPGIMETCSRSFYSGRTNLLSLLKRDGVSLGEFTSMVIIVSCHLRMHIRIYQMPVYDKTSPCWCYSSLCSYLSLSTSHVFENPPSSTSMFLYAWPPLQNSDIWSARKSTNSNSPSLCRFNIIQVHKICDELKISNCNCWWILCT